MADHVTQSLVIEINDGLRRLHAQPELDARDRRSIFIIQDMIFNFSFERERQRAALNELINMCNEGEQSDAS